MKFLGSLLALTLFVGLSACDAVDGVDASPVVTADASPNAAFVSNSGRDDQACTLTSSTYGSGVGSATLLGNNNNILFRCAGTLNDPSLAPERADRFTGGGPFGTTCKITVTPSGGFNGACH